LSIADDAGMMMHNRFEQPFNERSSVKYFMPI